MIWVWLRFVDGPDPIVHVCLSIADQFFCKIMLVYFWVHLNTRPTYVIVHNLYLPSVLQDTTTNHTSGCIVVLRNLSKPYFFGPVKYSWRCIISYLIPSCWTWHCVYLIWTCPGFSMIFRMNNWQGQCEIPFQLYPFLVWVVFTLICWSNNSRVCVT